MRSACGDNQRARFCDGNSDALRRDSATALSGVVGVTAPRRGGDPTNDVRARIVAPALCLERERQIKTAELIHSVLFQELRRSRDERESETKTIFIKYLGACHGIGNADLFGNTSAVLEVVSVQKNVVRYDTAIHPEIDVVSPRSSCSFRRKIGRASVTRLDQIGSPISFESTPPADDAADLSVAHDVASGQPDFRNEFP